MTSFSIVVATFGDLTWAEHANRVAIPSALEEAERYDLAEVVATHAPAPAGLADARNLGASRAQGDWLVFLDADDELEPGFLDALAKIAGDAELLNPAVRYAHPDRVLEAVLIPERPLEEGNYLIVGTAIHRELWERHGGFEDWPVYEDWELFLRLTRAGARVARTPDAVYRANVHPGSRNTPSKVTTETYRAIRARHGIR